MKLSKLFPIAIISFLFLTGCNSEIENSFLNSQNESSTLTRSNTEENLAPIDPVINSLNTENLKTSYFEGYKAENIPFTADFKIYARFNDRNDSTLVKTFQNVVKIYNEINELKQEYLITIVPSIEYCENHESFNWNKFLFYQKDTDFCGYELISDTKGNICGIYYYENGKRQYGTFLSDNQEAINIKRAFLLKLANNISFVKIRNKTKVQYTYYEETEIFYDYSSGLDKPKPIELKWTIIIRIEDSSLDNGNVGDYIGGGGSSKDENDNLQQDYVEVDGSKFFNERFISEFPLEGGAESSPCYAISNALKYLNINTTPDEIWQEVDANNEDNSQEVGEDGFPIEGGSFMQIYNDYIDKDDLKTLVSKYFWNFVISPFRITSNIHSGRPCIAVYKTGTRSCIYKCVLAIGYTSNHEIIYVDPITQIIKKRPNDFLEGYCFALTEF